VKSQYCFLLIAFPIAAGVVCSSPDTKSVPEVLVCGTANADLRALDTELDRTLLERLESLSQGDKARLIQEQRAWYSTGTFSQCYTTDCLRDAYVERTNLVRNWQVPVPTTQGAADDPIQPTAGSSPNDASASVPEPSASPLVTPPDSQQPSSITPPTPAPLGPVPAKAEDTPATTQARVSRVRGNEQQYPIWVYALLVYLIPSVIGGTALMWNPMWTWYRSSGRIWFGRSSTDILARQARDRIAFAFTVVVVGTIVGFCGGWIIALFVARRRSASKRSGVPAHTGS